MLTGCPERGALAPAPLRVFRSGSARFATAPPAALRARSLRSRAVNRRLQLNSVELILENHSGDQVSGHSEPFSALARWGLTKAEAQFNREPL